MIELDIIAKRYGVLPSSLKDTPIEDLTFNLFVASVAIEEENRQIEKQNRAMRGRKRGRL